MHHGYVRRVYTSGMDQHDPSTYVVCRCCGAKPKTLTGVHLAQCAGITTAEYRSRYPDAPFMSEATKRSCARSGTENGNWQGGKTIKYCGCGQKLSRRNRSGLCRPCSTRGERNPFYGKTHDPATRQRMAASQQVRDPSTRSGGRRAYADARAHGLAVWAKRTPEEQEAMKG